MSAKKLYSILFLALLNVLIYPQEGSFVLHQGYIQLPEDITTKVLLVVSVEKREKNFQVTGTYYDYRGKSWNSIGKLSGTLFANNKFKGEKTIYSISENTDGDYIELQKYLKIGEYIGYRIKTDLAGIYYKEGNEKDVGKISQDGPFIEFSDENSNVSKGVITDMKSGVLIDGNIFFAIDEDKIVIRGVDWKRNADNKKDFTGEWNTNWGSINLTQSGNKVTGTYGKNGGKIENGTVTASGDTLVCNGDWIGSDTKGKFIFRILGEAFWGSWNYSTSPDDWNHDWNGSRWKD